MQRVWCSAIGMVLQKDLSSRTESSVVSRCLREGCLAETRSWQDLKTHAVFLREIKYAKLNRSKNPPTKIVVIHEFIYCYVDQVEASRQTAASNSWCLFTPPPPVKFSHWKGLLIYSMLYLYIVINNDNNDDDDDDHEQCKRNTTKTQYNCSSTYQFWQAAYSDV